MAEIDLTKQKCEPCEGGVPPMKEDEIKENLAKVDNWKVIDNHHLINDYKFKNFKEVINFVNKILPLAEEMNHHPNLFIHSYKKLKIVLFTHSENKITDKDYNLAKKIDEIK